MRHNLLTHCVHNAYSSLTLTSQCPKTSLCNYNIHEISRTFSFILKGKSWRQNPHHTDQGGKSLSGYGRDSGKIILSAKNTFACTLLRSPISYYSIHSVNVSIDQHLYIVWAHVKAAYKSMSTDKVQYCAIDLNITNMVSIPFSFDIMLLASMPILTC